MEYGKFNSAEELLKGYNELEKSFTQKCQQLSELRSKLVEDTGSSTNEKPSPQLPELRSKFAADTGSSTTERNTEQQGGTNENSSPLVTQQGNGSAAEEQVACAVPADVDASSAVSNSQSPATPLPKVMQGGGNISMALPTKPKTIKEASVLARKIFDN